MMEDRRDILVAAIGAHDQFCIYPHSQVSIPSPMVMGDRSCGSIIEEAKGTVHKRVKWLNKQIEFETTRIHNLFTRDVNDWMKRDRAAEQRRQKT